jgi:hypothetical protein
MTNYYPTVNVDPEPVDESCDHTRYTFHRSTSYSSAYFECYDCGAFAEDWTDEAEQDEDGIVSKWREPIWPEDEYIADIEMCDHGLSLWLCADPVNHYPPD